MGRIIKGRWYKSGGASTVVEVPVPVPVPVPAPPNWIGPTTAWIFDAPMQGAHAGSNLYAGDARDTSRWNHNNGGTITADGLVFSGSNRRSYTVPYAAYADPHPLAAEIEFDFPAQLRSQPVLLVIGTDLSIVVGHSTIGGALGFGVIAASATRFSISDVLTVGGTYRIRLDRSGASSWSVKLNDVVVGTYTHAYKFVSLSTNAVVVGGSRDGALVNFFTGTVRNVRVSHPYVTQSP